MAEETKELTNEEIQKIFNERKQKNLEDCQGEINAVLAKYNCRMSPVTIIQDGKITTTITIAGN